MRKGSWQRRTACALWLVFLVGCTQVGNAEESPTVAELKEDPILATRPSTAHVESSDAAEMTCENRSVPEPAHVTVRMRHSISQDDVRSFYADLASTHGWRRSEDTTEGNRTVDRYLKEDDDRRFEFFVEGLLSERDVTVLTFRGTGGVLVC
jgi:hypothetical protein